MTTRTVTSCDCCHREIPKSIERVALTWREGVTEHSCLKCLEKNIAEAFSKMVDESKRSDLADLLLGRTKKTGMI